MPLFTVTPHPRETQLLASAEGRAAQLKADVVFEVMPNMTEAQTGDTQSLWSLVVDVSGSMQGEKMESVKHALKKILRELPESDAFLLQLVAFHGEGAEIIPPTPATTIQRRLGEYDRVINRLRAEGQTAMGRGLRFALEAFRRYPNHVKRTLLLSDGEQQGPEPIRDVYKVAEEIRRAGGQVDAWGVGYNWNAEELRHIANLGQGGADLIPAAGGMDAAIEAFFQDVKGTAASDVSLVFRTPKMYEIQEVKQVYPNIAAAQADKVSAQEFVIPLGTVTGQGVKILVRIHGVERPVGLAVRSIQPFIRYTRNGQEITEEVGPDANAFVKWVATPAEIGATDPQVARYRGEEEVVRLQEEGLKALERGDVNLATARLSQALAAAEASGSLATGTLKALFDPSTGRLKVKADSAEVKTAKLLSGQTGRLTQTGKL
jgi:hypothetical protein